MLNVDLGVGCNSNGGCDNNASGCFRTPDLCIKRNDTKPSFKISISDCDGVVDLTDNNLVLEANMWFEAKLKNNIDNSATNLSFADNVGFDQVDVGDVVIASSPRNLERMLVTAVNESNKSITVQRAYSSTPSIPSMSKAWLKGANLKIFKIIDQPAQIESVFEDVTQVDGSVQNELVETFMVFNWQQNHTNLAGCYFFEFKLIMISDSGDVVWIKRTPMNENGFLINIIDSSTPN